MRYKLLIIALFVLSASLSAQDTSAYERRHQLGVNATTFVKQFLSLNNSFFANSSPYIVTYKYIRNNKGVRIGAAAGSSSTNNNPNTGTPLTHNSQLTINARLGYEWQQKLSQRWLWYYGADVLYDYMVFKSKTTATSFGFPPEEFEITSENESFGAGAGPVLGLQFNIGKRISFNTETTAYYTYTETRVREKNRQGQGSSKNDFTATSWLSLVVPTSIFFVIHF